MSADRVAELERQLASAREQVSALQHVALQALGVTDRPQTTDALLSRVLQVSADDLSALDDDELSLDDAVRRCHRRMHIAADYAAYLLPERDGGDR